MHEGSPLPSLLHLQEVCPEDGPPLPLGKQLCGDQEPKVLHPLHLLRFLGEPLHCSRAPRRATDFHQALSFEKTQAVADIAFGIG